MAFTPLSQTNSEPLVAGFRPVSIGGIPQPASAPQQNPFMQANIGIAKGAGSSLVKAGAQNAGPVGADMLAHAPAFAQNIQSASDALKPSNPEQQFGLNAEQMAEYFIPATKAAKAEQAVNVITKGLGTFTGSIARVGLKSAIQGASAGVQKFAQTGDLKQAGETAAAVAGFRGGTAVIGEGARALHLPERLYSTLFKNSSKDMLAELKSGFFDTLQQTDPPKFQSFVDKGLIKVGTDGKAIVNDTLAEQALDRGLRGSIRNMANTVIEGTLSSEAKVQSIVENYKGTVSLPEKQFVGVLKSIAEDYHDVGFGEISKEASRLANELETGVASPPITDSSRLLPQGAIQLPAGGTSGIQVSEAARIPIQEPGGKFARAFTSEVRNIKGQPQSSFREIPSPASAAPQIAKATPLNQGIVSAQTALDIRRLLDKVRIATSFDKPASKLSLGQSNLKTLADAVRARVNAIPGMGETMKDYSFYIDALESLAKEAARRGNNQAISLIDSLFLSGAFGGNNPIPGLTAGMFRKLILSGPGMTAFAQLLNKGVASPLTSGVTAATASQLIPPTPQQ